MKRAVIGISLVLLLTGLAGPGWTGEEGGLKAGDEAITFTLQAINVPKRVNLKKYIKNKKTEKNKVVVLTFFASWCKPCKKELPHLQKVYEENKDKGLEIMAVFSEKDSVAWAKRYWDENKLSFLLLNDEYGIVMKRYEVKEYPTTFVINKEAKLAKKFCGYDETIEKECDELVASLLK